MSAVSSSKTSPEAASAELTLLQELAQRVHAFEKRQLTKAAIAQARACILDAIGVTLAGYPEPCTQILLKTPGVATAPGPVVADSSVFPFKHLRPGLRLNPRH